MNAFAIPTGADYITQRTRIDKSGCLIWTNYVRSDGYAPVKTITSGHTTAHRLAYLTFVGDIPEGHEVDHLCFNRSCVNPFHLEAVTPSENNVRRGAKRTHCPNGHPYDESNTYKRPGSNIRQCRECSRASRKRHKEKVASER